MIGLRRLILVTSVALTVGALSAFAVVSQAERDDSFEAIATVALDRSVEEDSLTSERQALVDRLDADWLASAVAEAGATEVEFLLPDRRNYVAVVARAPESLPARRAADAIAAEMVDRARTALRRPIDATLEMFAAELTALDGERSTRQAAVDAAIAREATLTVPLGELLPDDEQARQEEMVEAAQAEVNALRATRDEIVDDQDALANDLRRAELEYVRLEPPWVLSAREATDSTAELLRSAVVTFALAGLAAALCILVITSPPRTPQLPGLERS